MRLPKILNRLKNGIRALWGRRSRLKSPKKRREISSLKDVKKGGKRQLEWTPEFAEVESLKNSPSPIGAIQVFSGIQLSRHTQRAYKRDLQDFFGYLRTQDIWKDWSRQVSPAVVADFRKHLIEVKKLSKASITRKLAVVKSFYRWTVAQGFLYRNPADLIRSFPQTQESKTGFLTDAEVSKFLTHFKPSADSGLFEALAKTSVETLLMLGLRRSEACQIRMGDLEYNEDRWLVRIHGKGDRERRLPIPPRLEKTWSEWFRRLSDEAPCAKDLNEAPREWLNWLKRHSTQPLLVSSRAREKTTPLSSSELARIVRKSARKAGLLNRVSPHMLRATAITHALDQGATHRGVQQMAGWTSPLMITRYDKRRKDPRFSAIMNLKYAQTPTENGPETDSPKQNVVITFDPHLDNF